MWLYEKRLQYPVNVKRPDAKTAKIVMSQLGGPNGELGAALRYLSQRFTMPYPRVQALLTDIGTEELAHVEIISTLFYQLTNGLTPKEIKKCGALSKERIHENYTWDIVVDKYEFVFDKLLNEKYEEQGE